MEGGISLEGVCAVIAAVIAVGGVSYTGGNVAGEKAYLAGLRLDTYAKFKWSIRGFVCTSTPVFGAIFMLGFENKFYSMCIGIS